MEKGWQDRDGKIPAVAYVTLYNGEEVYETVTLSAENGWKHTWENLPADGNWQVVETNVALGYTPSYKVEDGYVKVTNVETLPQTGQLNWPIVLLGGSGLLMLLCGAAMVMRRKREADV